jgi:hypothetical protein
MRAAGVQLGIDFGTSNTVAMMRWTDGRVRPLLFEESPLLPSSVYAEPAGGLVVGRDAVHSARLEPSRFEPNPKRRIDEGSVLLGDRAVLVRDLVSAVLARVGQECHRVVGTTIGDVTVTYPAAWGHPRRQVLADAATAAGLTGVQLVAEPVAAAAYFTSVLGHDVPIGSAVMVYDFGAGTFDASVVIRRVEGFEVLAVDGRDDIGGVDVDAAIVEFVGRACAPHGPDAWRRLVMPRTVEDRRARRLLWDDARAAKERLSRQPTAELTVPLVGTDVSLTREQLEQLAWPLIEQTVQVSDAVVRRANLAPGRLAGVFLVGGSSRIPLVATALHRALGPAPTAIEQPELVVAEGSLLTRHAGQPRSSRTGDGHPHPHPHPGSVAQAPHARATPASPAGVQATYGRGPAARRAATRKPMLIGVAVAVVLIVLIGAGIAVKALLNDNTTPKFAVGSCVKQSGSRAEQVDCSTAGAFRVVSRETRREDCADQSMPVVRINSSGGKEGVLCLEPASVSRR